MNWIKIVTIQNYQLGLQQATSRAAWGAGAGVAHPTTENHADPVVYVAD